MRINKISLLLIFLVNFSFAIPSTTNIQKTTFSSLNKFILKNGIRIICQKDSTSSLTVARIFIKGGKLAEPEGKSGLSFLTTRLAVDPGSSNDVQKIATMGSKISVNGSFDYTTIEIECLSKNFEKTIKIISKSFTKPLFSGIRINRIKKIMEARQKREKEEPWLLIENIHNNLRFGKKHYGNPVYGNEESIKSINKKDIKNFYNAYFRGENLIISVVTDLDSNAVYDIIKKYFSKIPAGESKLKKNKAQIILQAQDKFIYKNRRQSLIMIAYPQSEINEKNFALGYLLNVLIGKGTYSRLWALRQKEKLAYSIRSKVNFMLFAGTFSACIETHHDNQEKTVKLLKNEFKKLIENGVSEEELEIAKINSIASFLRENESKSKKAFTFGYFEIHGLGYEYPNKFFNIIENISLKEFNTYIKKWLKPEYKIQIIIGKKAPQFIKASV